MSDGKKLVSEDTDRASEKKSNDAESGNRSALANEAVDAQRTASSKKAAQPPKDSSGDDAAKSLKQVIGANNNEQQGRIKDCRSGSSDGLASLEITDLRSLMAGADKIKAKNGQGGADFEKNATTYIKRYDEKSDPVVDAAAQELVTIKNELKNRQAEREEHLAELNEVTKESVPLVGKLGNVLNNGRSDEFNSLQEALLRQIKMDDKRIAITQEKLQKAGSHLFKLSLANDLGKFASFVRSGKREEADSLAIDLLKEHGASLSVLAPALWNELNGSEGKPGILKLCLDNGRAQTDAMPSYAGGTKNNPDASELGFKQALGLAAMKDGKTLGLIQLSPDQKLTDTAALRAYMNGRIDSDPVLSKFAKFGADLNGPVSDLSKMFEAAQSGTVYESFIDGIKERSAKVKEVMDRVSEADLFALEKRIHLMSNALKEMKSEKTAHDVEAIDILEGRISALKNTHNVLNKFDRDPKYPEVIRNDEGQTEKTNPIKNLREITDKILNDGIQPSTLTNWLKQNGVVIAASIAAMAGTVAAISTWGVGTPLATGAGTGLSLALTGLAARELTVEALYQYNKDDYSGYGVYAEESHLGKFARAAFDKTATENLKSFGLDVALPYTKDILRDWATFMVAGGIVNRAVGGSETFKKAFANLLQVPPANAAQLCHAAERAALMEGGGGRASSFMRQFMQNFGNEVLVNSGFTTAQLAAEQGVSSAMSKEFSEKIGEWGHFGLNFAISTGIALGQGARHGNKLLADATMNGNRMEFKLAEGVSQTKFIEYMNANKFEVKTRTNGRLEVRPMNAPPNFKSIEMENVSNRGSGVPHLEIVPVGTMPALRPLDSAIARANPHLADLHSMGTDFMAGDYNKVSTKARNGLNKSGVKIIETDTAFSIASYGSDPAYFANYLESMGKAASVIVHSDGNVNVRLPEPVVSSRNAKINLLSGEVTVGSGKPIRVNPETGLVDLRPGAKRTAAETDAGNRYREVKEAIRPEHLKRIQAEQAIILMEEGAHVAQAKGALSPTYRQFLKDMELTQHEEKGGARTEASREQELILALHDAGWPAEMIEHHFGKQHVYERQSAFEYLKARDAVGKIPDSYVRDYLLEGLQKAPINLRRAIIERLPEILKTLPPERAIELGDSMELLNALANRDRKVSSATPLLELPARFETISKELMKSGAFQDVLLVALNDSDIRLVDLNNQALQNTANTSLKMTIEQTFGNRNPEAIKFTERVVEILSLARESTLTPEQQTLIRRLQRDKPTANGVDADKFVDLLKKYGYSKKDKGQGKHNVNIEDRHGKVITSYSQTHVDGSKDVVLRHNYDRFFDAVIESVKAGIYHQNM